MPGFEFGPRSAVLGVLRPGRPVRSAARAGLRAPGGWLGTEPLAHSCSQTAGDAGRDQSARSSPAQSTLPTSRPRSDAHAAGQAGGRPWSPAPVSERPRPPRLGSPPAPLPGALVSRAEVRVTEKTVSVIHGLSCCLFPCKTFAELTETLCFSLSAFPPTYFFHPEV